MSPNAIWLLRASAKRLLVREEDKSGMAVPASGRAADKKRDYPPHVAVLGWILFAWAAEPFFTLITTFVFAPFFATHVASDPPSASRCGALPPPPQA